MKQIINGLNKLKAGQQIDDAELRYRICEEAKKVVEKQVPKKVIEVSTEQWINFVIRSAVCPNCKTRLSHYFSKDQKLVTENDYRKFCPSCGQALDWSEE